MCKQINKETQVAAEVLFANRGVEGYTEVQYLITANLE